MANPTQPNQAASTVHNVSTEMWCLWEEKSWQPQKQNLLAAKHAQQSQGHGFPPTVTGTNRSCLLTTSAFLAAACTQQRRQFPPSASDTTTVNVERTRADRWGRSRAGYPGVFSGVQGPQLTASPGADSLICGVLGPYPISSSNLSS